MAEGQRFKPWGQIYYPGIKRGDGAVCPKCGWDMYESTAQLPSRIKAIIGFSLEQPAMTSAWLSDEPRIGIIIIECPECFKKFWHHCTAEGYEVKQLICPQWPKKAGD